MRDVVVILYLRNKLQIVDEIEIYGGGERTLEMLSTRLPSSNDQV